MVHLPMEKAMKIGKHELPGKALLAPMAGVTDRPFRILCKKFGAALASSEMVGAQSFLQGANKTHQRANFEGEVNPKSVQLVGTEPDMLASVAAQCEQMGVDIIDINMGCPAKKVCKVLAGSALLKDPELVEKILRAIVGAVSIPVTLKIRTGWCRDSKNAVDIAKLAQDCGIQALAIHGRTRACRFLGEAEYDTIKLVKSSVDIPIIANGDITTPEKAGAVLQYTGADAVMIGRAAQGYPWIFRQINDYLAIGKYQKKPLPSEVATVLCEHLLALREFYGPVKAAMMAKKHISWYSKGLPNGGQFRQKINTLSNFDEQWVHAQAFFEEITNNEKDKELVE